MRSMLLSTVVAVAALADPSRAFAQYDSVNVEAYANLNNESPYTISVRMSVGGRAGRWQQLAPGQTATYAGIATVIPAYYYDYSYFADVEVLYNGVVRKGKIYFKAQSGRLFAHGDIFRRSPGVLGIHQDFD